MEFYPLGDRAIVIRVGTGIDEATHRRVRAICARLDERPAPGTIEYVPAFASVTVHYDPARVGARAGESPYARVEAAVARHLADLDEGVVAPPRIVEIPVCYGGEFGPDLEFVAGRAGLDPDEVVAIHAAGDYRVYMIGFAPGFPYLGGLPQRIAMPRRATPRTAVPAGSVGLAGAQTGIYPFESPGGWQLIGRTPVRLFTPDRDPPALLRVGNRVRFRAITPAEWSASGESRIGEWRDET